MSAAFEAATTEENFDLNEMDILELPGIETGKTIEFKTAESAAAEGGRQVVSLSPELMEMLVEKVVQRLSEKD